MAVSLNDIVSILSDRVGQPFNASLQAELKQIINYKRANYMQQFITKHPEQRKFFSQQFVADLIEVPSTRNICGVVASGKDCPILSTECDVPQPLRNSQSLFDYVGAANFLEPYGEVRPEYLQFAQCNKYTGNTPKYFYVDNKIFIYKDLTTRYVGVRGVFTYPEDINTCLCDDDQACFDDDSPYPIAEDLINSIIRDTLNVELRNVFPDFGEVKVDKTEDTTAANEE